MRLDARSTALTAGILWGASILLIGVGSMLFSGYGGPVLEMVSSIYPGFHNTGGFGDLIVGTLYGLADGLIGGFVFAWLYNRLVTAGVPA